MDWKILIVDDELQIRRTLKNYLTLNGYEVVTAGSGPEALEMARHEKLHIVLLDIKMPGMDGLTVLEKLREMDFSIQVIMMTGFSTFDSTLKALEKGATDYILKPFDDLDSLVKLIDLAAEKLGRWRVVLAGSSKNFAGQRPPPGDPPPPPRDAAEED